VDVSAALAEKMLEREVNENDHRALIDSFIDKIGEE
jgi:F0F1-type ATP synthase membrane subunit b/b'